MEGGRRTGIADEGLIELAKSVDSLITIPNEKLLQVLGSDVTLLDAFSSANDVLQGAVQGIAELITRPGEINVDFADVRTVMSEMGMAMMGTGVASGEDRAREAAEAAISSPLLEDINLSGANGILVNVCAGADLGLQEFNTIGETVREYAADDATVVIGTVLDPDMGSTVRVTVVATGLGKGIGGVVNTQGEIEPIEGVGNRTRAAEEGGQRNGEPDYSKMDVPPGIREEMAQKAAGHDMEGTSENLDLLDIPAFLRRQAD
jgi:cell division protein FtsZ